MFIEFKDNEKYASKGADTSDFHDSFKDCGYLLKENDIVVDIDNMSKESIKSMIDLFDIKTQIVHTERGCHLYFEKPKGFKGKKEAISPLGIKVEYKTSKNTPNGITIKRNGKLREIENAGNREPLPDFIFANKKFEDMSVGEGGRNNRLYAHKFKIMGLTDYKKILKFINEHVFDEPLSEDEFETIAREEDIQSEQMSEYDVAMVIKKRINLVEFADQFYWYQDGRYKQGNLKREVAKHLKGAKSTYIDEVAKQLDLYPDITEQPDKGFDVKFKNGILRDGKWIPVDSPEFTPYYIDIQYNPEIEPVQVVDDYLNQLTEDDEEYKRLVIEMISHALITNVEFKRKLAKFSIIHGKGGEGKGTLLEIISKILGKENCSYNTLDKLPDERYAYNIEGKLANLGDDIVDKPITNEEMKMLKNISTCDTVMVRALHKMARQTRLTASLIFTSNNMLKTHEKGDSYQRRVNWCPMFNKPVEPDGLIITKLTTPEALEYWLKLVIDGYFRLYTNGKFTVSKKVDEYTANYHEENNTCVIWVKEQKVEYFLDKQPPRCFEDYEVWAIENEGKAQSPRTVKNTIESMYGLTVIPKYVNGKTSRVYGYKNK